MNSLRLPGSSPSWVDGDAPAKISTGMRLRAALWTAPASDCVPHSTWTRTAWARPVTWATPCAALSATISAGQVMSRGTGRPVAAAAASASRIAGWSLPKLANRYETPAVASASRSAALAVCMEGLVSVRRRAGAPELQRQDHGGERADCQGCEGLEAVKHVAATRSAEHCSPASEAKRG